MQKGPASSGVACWYANWRVLDLIPSSLACQLKSSGFDSSVWAIIFHSPQPHCCVGVPSITHSAKAMQNSFIHQLSFAMRGLHLYVLIYCASAVNSQSHHSRIQLDVYNRQTNLTLIIRWLYTRNTIMSARNTSKGIILAAISFPSG